MEANQSNETAASSLVTKHETVKFFPGKTIFNTQPALIELGNTKLKLTLLDTDSAKQLETVFDIPLSQISKVSTYKGRTTIYVGSTKYNLMFPNGRTTQDWISALKSQGVKGGDVSWVMLVLLLIMLAAVVVFLIVKHIIKF